MRGKPIAFFEQNPDLKDFRNFLYLVWRALRLPNPTPIQDDIAAYLQHGPDKLVIEGFRGVAKTWITAALVVWELGWDPNKNVMIVSASKTFADDVSTFVLQIIRHTLPGLRELDCDGKERHSKLSFDVGPAEPNKDPSVYSVGITGQIAGHRADVVVADDVEANNNTLTQAGREKIAEAIREFDAVVKPGGRIIYLGTPRTEQSIYELLSERGYEIRVWPVAYPTPAQRKAYGARLSPKLAEDLDAGRAQPGDPTDPTRFSAEEIAVRRAGWGKAGFALQYMLDTSLSDVGRYPLRLSDLCILDFPLDVGPERVVWSSLAPQAIHDLTPVGLNGDRYYAPIVDPAALWVPWQGSLMFIDPAGGGKDETAYAVVHHLNGALYCPECTGLEGGYSDATLAALAAAAARHKVNRIVVESNFGDGMFSKLLLPHVQRAGRPCGIEDLRVHTRKEHRILDTLEPVMGQHRLVVSPDVFRRDGHRNATLPMETAHQYLLAYQLTRMAREKGCLAHDDRIDALAGAVGCWVDAMAKDTERSADKSRMDAFYKDLDAFVAHAHDRPPRGRGSWVDRSPATNRLR